jgi:hypothetical protein
MRVDFILCLLWLNNSVAVFFISAVFVLRLN